MTTPTRRFQAASEGRVEDQSGILERNDARNGQFARHLIERYSTGPEFCGAGMVPVFQVGKGVRPYSNESWRIDDKIAELLEEAINLQDSQYPNAPEPQELSEKSIDIAEANGGKDIVSIPGQTIGWVNRTSKEAIEKEAQESISSLIEEISDEISAQNKADATMNDLIQNTETDTPGLSLPPLDDFNVR